MKTISKKRICTIFLALMFVALCPMAIADSSYPSYNYNVYGESVPVPVVYRVKQVIGNNVIGTSLKSPSDIFLTDKGELYILDSGNNRIVVTDESYKAEFIIDKILDENGKPVEGIALNNAKGIFVNTDETIWIALGADEAVIQIDNSGHLLKVLKKPTGNSVPDDMFFKPSKVLVGPDDTIYIVSEGVYQGIITLNPDGKFLGFYGSNKVDVTLSVLTSTIWKKFYSLFSDTAVENMENIVPIEYSSMTIDKKGFIFAVTATSENSMYEIKKLDPKGNNIIRVKSASDVSAGVKLNIGNYGDIEVNYEKGMKVDTKFVDVSVDENGFVNALDQQRGRIFQYDSESNLIGIFGGYGLTEDTFIRPVAVEAKDDLVFVLDSDSATITVFEPTSFGKTIREATQYFNQGYYEKSEKLWLEVLNKSTNYDLAYSGLAKALYSRHDYKGAMKYARLGYDKKTYDEAFTQMRKDAIRNNMGWICFGIVICVAVLLILKRLKIREKLPAIKNPKYIPVKEFVLHPFQAADDIKVENRGVLWHAVLIVVLLALTRVLSLGVTGFLFNNTRLELIDVNRELLLVFGLYTIFVISNWSVCTLMDGEGKWREIIMVGGYSLTPMVIANTINIILSNVLTLREGAILSLISAVATYWCVFLLFVSILTIHRYSAGKAIGSIIITVLGMAFIVFLGVLIYSLFSQFLTFISNILTEILFRI